MIAKWVLGFAAYLGLVVGFMVFVWPGSEQLMEEYYNRSMTPDHLKEFL